MAGLVVKVSLDSAHVEQVLRLARERSANAIARALNRAAGSTNTAMVRACAQDMAMKQTDVRKYVVVRNATGTRLEASVAASGARISLKDFGATQTRRGVTANTGGGRKVYPGAFIMRKNGHAFARLGRKRFPIVRLDGPSLPHVFDKHSAAGVARGEEQLLKNLRHELKFATLTA